MRLLRLYLGSYRVLRNLDIRFGLPTSNEVHPPYASSYALDFLVGVNGTGKSTVLRAIADLMRKLERNEPILFPFEMEYELGVGDARRSVKLTNRFQNSDSEEASGTGALQTWVNGELRDLSSELLPARVMAFTTGSEVEWAETWEREWLRESTPEALRSLSVIERAIRELPGKPPEPETIEATKGQGASRFLLIRSQWLSLVTLCGLLNDMAAVERPEGRRLYKVLNEASIGTMRGFSLKFRMNQGVTSLDDRFQVSRLAKYASRALRLGSDHLLVFDLTGRDHVISQQILEEFSDSLQLFETLARLATAIDHDQPILQEINVFLERPVSPRRAGVKRDRPPMHLLTWLSDGEQSFLGRMCLFSLLGATEALILLDEPEVHFNDYWKRQIVHLLDEVLQGRHSHVLMATHSSIVLTDVSSEDIIVLNREGPYTNQAFNPSIQTFAADPSDILVHVFGAPQAAGEQSVTRIQKVLDGLPDLNPDEQRKQLQELLAVVGPGYWSYRIRRALQDIEGG
jgi:predicted ATPase